MKDKKFDSLMRQAFTWMEKQKKTKVEKQGSQREECLSEEIMCDYMKSRLSLTELDKVEEHLSVCSQCRRLLTTIVQLEKTEEVESSTLIKDKIGVAAEGLKICLGWIQGHLKVIETNAEASPFWNALQPVLVRGASGKHDDLQRTFPSIPPFAKTIKEYKVVVQVGKEEKGKCEVRCQISPLAKKSMGLSIRVDLLQAERTLSSYPLEDDAVLFNGIEPGKYKIKIREADRELAFVTLDISGEDME